MWELTAETVPDYLRGTGRVPVDLRITAWELSGGVSNVVIRVDVDGRPPLVIKQCRERLRVAMEWRARLDRIWAEQAALEILADVLPTGTVPAVLFEDRGNYLFAMSCAPDTSTTWKAQLMEGSVNPQIAARLGTILAAIHADSRNHPELWRRLSDTSLFDELRIDPYYRTTAQARPEAASRIEALIASMDLPGSERTLVLGDFSPKNILVHPAGLILLDFECAHAGDPAFDLGFFLSHLTLKAVYWSIRSPGREAAYLELPFHFWDAYLRRLGNSPWPAERLVPRAIEHTAACLLARVDGKSPVEYLDPQGQNVARRLGLRALSERPASWAEMSALVAEGLGQRTSAASVRD